jgi:hypothetical protein
MSHEKQENAPIIVPALGTLSESEDRPDYYNRIRILGLRIDQNRFKYFRLGIEQPDGRIINLKPRLLPERQDDLMRYQDRINEIRKK